MTLPVVDVVNVTRSFPGPPEVQALKSVNLRINRGDYVSIVGPSGSGKSTMLNVLGLLDRPSVGEYYLDGTLTAIADEDERAALRARKIGFVFQAFHLLPHRTVLDNVLLATLYSGVPRAEREQRARDALERVGLGHRVGFKPTTLSGGEQQRVAVARAVVAQPTLLLADEPTGNLDSERSVEIMQLLTSLNRDNGITVLMVTHEPDMAAFARTVVHFKDGLVERIEAQHVQGQEVQV